MKYDYITFKQFSAWCNRRAADGKWGMAEAIACSQLCTDMYKVFFLKRERVWKKEHEKSMRELVNEIEHLIELDEQGKLKAKNDARKAYTNKCYEATRNSRYNQPEFRQLDNQPFYIGMPFIVKPEAAYTGKKLPNETTLHNIPRATLGDYMSQPYDKCYLKESMIYNEYLDRFVYSLDIDPTNSDIYDQLIVLTSENIDDFDGDAIDKFILSIMTDSFLEYDKDEINKMIADNNSTIEMYNKKNMLLRQLL